MAQKTAVKKNKVSLKAIKSLRGKVKVSVRPTVSYSSLLKPE